MDFLTKHTTTNNPVLKIVSIIIFVLIPILGFVLGMRYQSILSDDKQFIIQNIQTTSVIQQNLDNNCKNNSRSDINEILVKYTVKQGDSLLSIARNELGDPSRIQELAVMNADKYPGLFSSTGVLAQNPFLEQGWTMSLPPKWITNSSGQLDIINGVIFNIRSDDKSMEISSKKDQSGHYATITLDKDTINQNKVNYKIGDCISAIRDIRLNKILKINLQ